MQIHDTAHYHLEAQHREPITIINIVHFHLFLYHRSQESEALSCTPPVTQSKFLVFESALMLLFMTCRFCGNSTRDLKKTISGSFLQITQYCAVCRRRWNWESQPLIGTIPAGNILISAAILYAGALPAKALRIFTILQCATITRKTFFSHQKEILQPAVHYTWEKHQKALFQEICGRNLVLSGDGRADSPGHCAKYGSYSVVEMSCNKVLDFKLVQVYIYTKCVCDICG